VGRPNDKHRAQPPVDRGQRNCVVCEVPDIAFGNAVGIGQDRGIGNWVSRGFFLRLGSNIRRACAGLKLILERSRSKARRSSDSPIHVFATALISGP
jgi:hypothetical protein